MSKLTAAYVAGYIDGEGYLGIMKTMRHETAKNPTYMPVIKIASTDEWIIDWFKDSFGGWKDKRTFPNQNHKDAYTWTIAGKKIEPVLRKVHPYLRLKKPQADIIFKRLKMYKPGYKFNDKEVEFMESLCIQIRELNKRGKN